MIRPWTAVSASFTKNEKVVFKYSHNSYSRLISFVFHLLHNNMTYYCLQIERITNFICLSIRPTL